MAGAPVYAPGADRAGRPTPVPLARTQTATAPAPGTFGLSHDACNPELRESFAELVEESLIINGLPLLRHIPNEGSPLIEAGLLDPDGLKAAVVALETEPYHEEPHSKLVEVITLDQAVRAFLP